MRSLVIHFDGSDVIGKGNSLQEYQLWYPKVGLGIWDSITYRRQGGGACARTRIWKSPERAEVGDRLRCGVSENLYMISNVPSSHKYK